MAERATDGGLSGTCREFLGGVARMRRRWRVAALVGAAAVAAMVAEAVMALLLLASALGGSVGGGLWIGVGVALLSGAVCGGAMLVHLLDAPVSDAVWAARRALQPRSAEPLRTALELAHATAHSPLGAAATGGSLRLVEAAVQGAAPHLDQLEAAIERQRRGNGKLLLWVVALTAAQVASMIVTPEPWRALVSRPNPARRVGPVEVGTLVGDTHLRIEPPAYARDALAAEELALAETTVLRGSTLQLRARALPGYQQLSVEVARAPAPGDAVKAARAAAAARVVSPTHLPDGAITWRQVVAQPTRYRYTAIGAGGQLVRERGWREVEVRPDGPPEVALLAPEGEIEVRAGDHVVVEGEVNDDIGLSAVELVIAVPAGGVERRPVAFQAGDRRAEVRESLEVDKLDLRPGEFASVHIEAADNNALEGSRRSASGRVLLRMFSAERTHARILDLMAEVALTWTLRLAERLERDPSHTAPELEVALKHRAELASAEVRALAELVHLLRLLNEDVLSRADTSADIKEIERLLRDRLAEEDRAIERIAPGGGETRAARHLFTLKRLHTRMIASEERAVLLLASLAMAEHRGAMVRDGRGLEQAEQRLEEALEAIARKPDEAGRAEAERLLDAVQAQVERMLQSASKQLRIVPAEHINPGALEPSGLHGTMRGQRDALRAVRNLIRDGKIAEATRALARMREATRDLMQQLRADAERRRTGEDAALQRLVGRLRQGIDRARQGQSELRETVRPAAEDQTRASAAHLRRNLEAVLGQVRALLDDARDQVRPQRLDTPQMRASRAIAGARSALSTARGAVEATDVGGALQALVEADERLTIARRDLEEAQTPGDIQAELKASDLNRLRQSIDRAGRAAVLLRETLPSPHEMLEPAARRQLGGFGKRQESLRRALQKVRQQLAREGEGHPGLQNQVGARLDHALQMMRQSGGSLQGSDPSRAFEQMAETLGALQRAKELLQEQGNPAGAAASMAAPAAGHGPSRERVEVRQGNSSDAREDFRRQVLEALQRKAPGPYRERLRRYFEEIVK